MKMELSGLYLEITSSCNRSCPYCYNDSMDRGNFLDINIIYKLIDECKLNRISQITISGGEPFLHPEIYRIIQYINSKGMSALVITNLSYLPPQKAVDLLKRGNYIQLTIDSVIKEKNDKIRGDGSFELVEKLLYLANKNNVQTNITLRMNLGKSNINEVSAFIEFAKSYGINQAATLLIAKIGRGKDYPDAFDYKESILEIAEIVEELKSKQEEEKGEIDFAFSNLDEQRGCAIFGSGPLKCVPRVTPSGDVFFCSYFFGEENVLGNIKNQSLMDILESKTSKKFIELVRLRKNNQKCSKCLFSDFCMCGCPAVSYMHTENLFETSDQCEMIKYFIKKQIIKNN